jgi:hypothetical protein
MKMFIPALLTLALLLAKSQTVYGCDDDFTAT